MLEGMCYVNLSKSGVTLPEHVAMAPLGISSTLLREPAPTTGLGLLSSF